MLGPNLLNSCIIDTDYLHFPARQFVTYSFRDDAGLAQGAVDGRHHPHPVQPPFLPPCRSESMENADGRLLREGRRSPVLQQMCAPGRRRWAAGWTVQWADPRKESLT